MLDGERKISVERRLKICCDRSYGMIDSTLTFQQFREKEQLYWVRDKAIAIQLAKHTHTHVRLAEAKSLICRVHKRTQCIRVSSHVHPLKTNARAQ